MDMDQNKKIEFERIAREMMNFLRDNYNPHVHVVIDCKAAELSEGIICCKALTNQR